MKLVVERLSDAPQRFEFERSAQWWEERVGGAAHPEGELLAPFRFVLDAHRIGSKLFLRGSAAGEIRAECGRCLARYCHALQCEFKLVLEPAGDQPPTEPAGAEELARDGMMLSDKLELGWYRGPEIDLENYLGEVIALSMPVQPVCRDDCEGLCPVCGVDRNQTACGCTQKNPESPFAVLAALRDDLTKGKI